ncbi:hypothetical protein ScPMuIL_009195, partial [Solemya velum]
MDTVGKVVSSFNASVLKEPRGFIKPIQWILSIFAFATITSGGTSLIFTVACFGKNLSSVKLEVAYPYDIENSKFQSPVCQPQKQGEIGLFQGSAAAAQFYVFVGVIVFIYCICALIFYIFFDDLYRKNNLFVIG